MFMRSLFVLSLLIFANEFVGATLAARKSHISDIKCETKSQENPLAKFKGSMLHKHAENAIIATESVAESGSSEIFSSIFNLAKTILGAGVLSIPSGIASFSDSPSALGPSIALLLFMGVVSAYSFSSIGKACKTHNTKSFSEAWAKSVESDSGVLISSIITFKTGFACLAYSIIIGDSFSQILKSFGLPDFLTLRSNVILGMTSLLIFPLCCLKNLDALKYTSLLGLAGTLYCAIFMSIRYFDGSYLPGGRFFDSISAALQPKFGSTTQMDTSIFNLVGMLSSAYVAHYNAPKFWAELKNPTTARYDTVVTAAFGFAALMYLVVMCVGFLTFGKSSSGLILNNYSSGDKLATVARIAIGTGILCGYPLTFTALRDGAMEILKVPQERRGALFVPLTVGLLGVLTSLALVLKNVGAVVSFGGALIGSMLIYFVPAFMNVKNIKRTQSLQAAGHKQQSLELAVNYGIAFMGLTIAVIGVYTNLKGAGAAH